jgi:hypothetical protein
MSAEIGGGGFLGGGVSVFFLRVGPSFGERRGCCGGPVLLAERCGGRRNVLKAKLELRG